MSRPRREHLGYQVMLPGTCAQDTAQLTSYIGKVVEDLPRLAGRAALVVDPDTVVTSLRAYQLPELDDAGKVRVMGRGADWVQGEPIPEWADGVLVRVTAFVKGPGDG